MKNQTASAKIREDLEKRWYATWDYSVYDEKDYLDELLFCWDVYSRKYLNNLCVNKTADIKVITDRVGEIKSVLDLGCGIGLTTARLKQLFPNAEVYGTNLESTIQYRIAKELGKLLGFTIVEKPPARAIDLIFASEYFEHIESPVEHLMEILVACQPKFLVIANAFNAMATGHFYRYRMIHGEHLDGIATSRIFNDTLRQNGYRKVKTQLWNNRPSYWAKDPSFPSTDSAKRLKRVKDHQKPLF